MPMDSASCRGSRLASACLGIQMRSFAAKCDLPPHTEAASTAFSASTVAPCRRRSQILQPTRHKLNPRLRHGQIISTRPNRVFTRRIAVALGIYPRNDAESVLTSRTFAE
ncbi:hypothetical protein DPMN_019577 [Dreissena polymorpha]|uniref:Uncharacterized protein n=1 Tax=Dreissena polymorpha TaxID=45954 RepID=A0A9D4NFA0_DREPO|nr:hypothetical protein DPMN_019577 [Dreissena polymorpha]